MAKTKSQKNRDPRLDDDRLLRSIEVKEVDEEEDGAAEPETDQDPLEEDAELDDEVIDPFGDKWEQ